MTSSGRDELTAVLGGDVVDAARALLGARLTHSTPAGAVSVEITEVEAYAGALDPASHAFRGPTPRTGVMFGEPGRLYVYRSYGIHACMNVVTGPDGVASAVLLRAGRVVEGVDRARVRRGPRVPESGLARGPGNLAQALGVDLSATGHPLWDAPLTLGLRAGEQSVSSGPRVGIAQAADVPWRFWLTGDPTVSTYRRSPRA